MFYAQKGSLLVELGEDDGVGIMSPNRRKENEEFLSFFVEGIVRVEYFLYLCGGFEIELFNLLCIMDILAKMLERAQQNQKRIVLPEGDEPRTLEAANIILRDKIAKLILIGDPAVIRQMAAEKGYEHIEEATLFDPQHDPKMAEYAHLLYE